MTFPRPRDIELPQDNPNLRLGDVDDLVREHPAFTTPAVRTLIHRAKHNGLNQHIYRLGRKVMIDLNGFQDWVRSKQGATS